MKTGPHSTARTERPSEYVPKIHSVEPNRQQPPKGLRINEATTEALSELHICKFCNKKFKFKLLCHEHQNKCFKKPSGSQAHEEWAELGEPMTDEQLLAVLSSPSPPAKLSPRESPKKSNDSSATSTFECGKKSTISDDTIEEFVEIDPESVEDLEELSHSEIDESQSDINFETDTSTEIIVKANKAQVLDLVSKPLSILRKYGLYLENSPEPVEIETLRKYGIYLEDCPKVCDNPVPDSDINNNNDIDNDLTLEKTKKTTEVLVAESTPTKHIDIGKHSSKNSPKLDDVAVRRDRKSVGILDPLTKPRKKVSSIKLLSKRSNSLRAVKSSAVKDSPKFGTSSKEVKCIKFGDTLRSDEQIEVSALSKIAFDEHPENIKPIIIEPQNIVGPSKILKQTKLRKSPESVEFSKRNIIKSFELVDHPEVEELSETVDSRKTFEIVRCSKRIQTQRFKIHKPLESVDPSGAPESCGTVYSIESLKPSTTVRLSEVEEISDAVELLEVEAHPEIVPHLKRRCVNKSVEIVPRTKRLRFKQPQKFARLSYRQYPTKIVKPSLVQDPPESLEPSGASEILESLKSLENQKVCEITQPFEKRKGRKLLKVSEPCLKKHSKREDLPVVQGPSEVHREVSGIRASLETVKPNRGRVKGLLKIVKPSSADNPPQDLERSEVPEAVESVGPQKIRKKLSETVELLKRPRRSKPFKTAEPAKIPSVRELSNREDPSVIQEPPEKYTELSGILATTETVKPKRSIKGPLKIAKPSFVQDPPEYFEPSGAPRPVKFAESLKYRELCETIEPPKQRRGKKPLNFTQPTKGLRIKELSEREEPSANRKRPKEHTELSEVPATPETDEVSGIRNFSQVPKPSRLEKLIENPSEISKPLKRRRSVKVLKTEKSQTQRRFGRASNIMKSPGIDDLDEILDPSEFWEPFDAIPPSGDENPPEIAYPAKDGDPEIAGPSKVPEKPIGGANNQLPVSLEITESSTVRVHAEPLLVKIDGEPEVIDDAEDVGKIVSVPKQFLCNICQLNFPTASDLLGHSREHTYPKILLTAEQVKFFYRFGDRSICPICTKPLQNRYKSSFVKHLNTHIDLPQYTCPVCKSDFRRLDHMKTHLRRHILPEKR